MIYSDFHRADLALGGRYYERVNQSLYTATHPMRWAEYVPLLLSFEKLVRTKVASRVASAVVELGRQSMAHCELWLSRDHNRCADLFLKELAPIESGKSNTLIQRMSYPSIDLSQWTNGLAVAEQCVMEISQPMFPVLAMGECLRNLTDINKNVAWPVEGAIIISM